VEVRCKIKPGKIKPAMSYEFIERADELQPQAGSSRSGGPPRKSTLAGVLNPQNCPQCGQRVSVKNRGIRHEENSRQRP